MTTLTKTRTVEDLCQDCGKDFSDPSELHSIGCIESDSPLVEEDLCYHCGKDFNDPTEPHADNCIELA